MAITFFYVKLELEVTTPTLAGPELPEVQEGPGLEKTKPTTTTTTQEMQEVQERKETTTAATTPEVRILCFLTKKLTVPYQSAIVSFFL